MRASRAERARRCSSSTSRAASPSPAFPTGADLSATVEATNALLAAARSRSVPMIFTAIAYSEAEVNGTSVAWLAKAHGLRGLVEGTAAVALDPRLERTPDDLVVVKKGASAFFGTHVAAALAAMRVDTVVVCGATTSGCVRATVVDASRRLPRARPGAGRR